MPISRTSDDTIHEVLRLHAANVPNVEIAKRANISKDTVSKIVNGHMKPANESPAYSMPPQLPDPSPIAGGPQLPDPLPTSFESFDTQLAGDWLVLGDTHIPYHDKKTIELAVEEARRRNVVGVLLNGDVLDSHEVSDHERDRDALTYLEEIEMGQAFMTWLRSRLPKARIVYKEGNHDARVDRYVIKRAPALAGLEGVNLPSFLKLPTCGVEWVGDKRIVMLGKLPVIHGHEYRGGGGVNPARWLFLRAVTTSMCSHFHRASEHHQRGLSNKLHGVWSLGCACYLYPKWMPLNEWGHGFAIVNVMAGGEFRVSNMRVINGVMY